MTSRLLGGKETWSFGCMMFRFQLDKTEDVAKIGNCLGGRLPQVCSYRGSCMET